MVASAIRFSRVRKIATSWDQFGNVAYLAPQRMSVSFLEFFHPEFFLESSLQLHSQFREISKEETFFPGTWLILDNAGPNHWESFSSSVSHANQFSMILSYMRSCPSLKTVLCSILHRNVSKSSSALCRYLAPFEGTLREHDVRTGQARVNCNPLRFGFRQDVLHNGVWIDLYLSIANIQP